MVGRNYGGFYKIFTTNCGFCIPAAFAASSSLIANGKVRHNLGFESVFVAGPRWPKLTTFILHVARLEAQVHIRFAALACEAIPPPVRLTPLFDNSNAKWIALSS